MLAHLGCIEEASPSNDPPEPPAERDAVGGGGGAAGDVGAEDVSVADVEVVEVDSGDPLDALRPVDAWSDASVDAFELDAAPLEGTPPEYEQVGVAKLEETTYVAWVDGEDRVRTRTLEARGAWEGPSRVVGEGPADRLVAYTAQGVAWVAWSDGGGPIRLAQLSRSEGFDHQLELRGPPLLARADAQHLLVVGAHEDGRLGWQRIAPELSLEAQAPPIYDTIGLPRPDSLASVHDGVLMRFGASGQCVQLDSASLLMTSLPCRLVEGQLTSKSGQVLLTHAEHVDDVEYLAASPVFGDAPPFRLLEIEDPDLKRFPDDSGARVVVGRSVDRPEERGLALMAFIEPGRLLYSEAHPEWGFPRARAAVALEDIAYLFSFGATGEPRVDALGLNERGFDTTAYEFEPLGCEHPSAERCGGSDHDCDGQSENGLCCLNQSLGINVEIQLPEGATVLNAKIANHDENHHILATQIGPTSWIAWIIKRINPEIDPNHANVVQVGQCFNGENFGCPAGHSALCEHREISNEYHCLNEFEDSYQLQPFRVNNVAEVVDFIGINYSVFALVGVDTLGIPSVWWHYYRYGSEISRKEEIQCDQVLEASHLTSPEFGDPSILVVCPNKVIRMFTRDQFVDIEYQLDILDQGTIEWARLTPIQEDRQSLLVGYRRPDGTMSLAKYLFMVGVDQALGERLSRGLESLNSEEIETPIQLHSQILGPPIQVSRGHTRLLLNREDNHEPAWIDIITGEHANRTSYASTTQFLVTSAPREQGGFDFWAHKIPSERDALNPWSTQPNLTVEEGAIWSLNPTVYTDPLMVLDPRGGQRWRVRTYGFSCLEP